MEGPQWYLLGALRVPRSEMYWAGIPGIDGNITHLQKNKQKKDRKVQINSSGNQINIYEFIYYFNFQYLDRWRKN